MFLVLMTRIALYHGVISYHTSGIFHVRFASYYQTKVLTITVRPHKKTHKKILSLELLTVDKTAHHPVLI